MICLMSKQEFKMRMQFLVISLVMLSWFAACSNKAERNNPPPNESSTPQTETPYKKKASIYGDTLVISSSAVVFFHYDSLQEKHFQSWATPMLFESALHETVYQIKNARLVLGRHWKDLTISEADHHRFIAYYHEGELERVVDLNEINDLSGMLLFKQASDPLQADMMNVDTELDGYFGR
jgi:hypothetical protein